MKETNEKVYRCDFCNKHMISKGFMKYHEEWCKYNPKNMHKCFEFCQNLVRTEVSFTSEDFEYTRTRYNFHCNILDVELYSYKKEKRLLREYEGTYRLSEFIVDKQRMPLVCEHYRHMYNEPEIDNNSNCDVALF